MKFSCISVYSCTTASPRYWPVKKQQLFKGLSAELDVKLNVKQALCRHNNKGEISAAHQHKGTSEELLNRAEMKGFVMTGSTLWQDIKGDDK